MNTKKQIEECIKSLTWLKWNIVGDKEPKKNTFEYATKVYLENAIALLKDSVKSDVVLGIIKNKNIDLMALRHAFLMDKEGEESGFEWYNNLTSVKRGVYDALAKEEYCFLKEVML